MPRCDKHKVRASSSCSEGHHGGGRGLEEDQRRAFLIKDMGTSMNKGGVA